MRSIFGMLAATTLAVFAAPAVSAQSAEASFTLADVQKLADNGDAEAISTVGWFYETGREVKEDTAKAASLYRAAIAKGDSFGKWRLGVMIDEGKAKGTAAEAVALFRAAAADKSAGAMASLGMMYATGHGVAVDYDAAMRYYQAAARMGSAHGVEGIGVLYANGQGVKRDMNEALSYWMAASAGGDDDATALLMKFMPSSGTSEGQAIYARASTIADAYGIGDRDEGVRTAGSDAGEDGRLAP